jgi:CDP-diacylglycerol---glycerol-3-phosphate 3-phosphatidyltransferase
MFTDWVRKITQGIVNPIAAMLGRLGFTANTLTLVGCLLNIGVGVVIATGRLQLGGVLLIATASFDAFDGALARIKGQPTKFGAFLDSVLDRVSEAAVLLGLGWWYLGQGDRVAVMLVYVVLLGSILVSYARARAEGVGVSCKEGLLTRIERTILTIAGLILGLMMPVLWLLAVGTVVTAIHRIIHVYRVAKDTPL